MEPPVRKPPRPSEQHSMYQAIFVTGAPAVGKTTLLKELETRVSPVKVVEFGRLIADRLRVRGREVGHDELRSQSARIVSPQVVAALDAEIAKEIVDWLAESHVVIASHAVTHEDYGVRVTAFSEKNLAKIPLSAVVVLQAPADVLLARVEADGRGRMWKTLDQARRLQALQTALALTYGVVCGCPVYVIAADKPPTDLVAVVLGALQRDGTFL